MYRFGVKSCLGSPICSEGEKNIFTLYLIFLNHVTPIKHVFQLKVCLADF